MFRWQQSLLLVALTPLLALAVVEVETPLQSLVAKSEQIVVGEVRKLDREKEQAIIVVGRTLKGEALERLSVKLHGSGDGRPDDMLARIDDGMTLVLFVAPVSPSESQIFAYGNGSWFQLRGASAGGVVRSQFLQGEPYLRKTFHGGTDELVKLLTEGGPLPDLDKQAKPGLGPTVVASAEKPAEVATNSQIELGPAWTSQPSPDASNSSETPLRYMVPVGLGFAGLAFVFLLTRSAPTQDVRS